MKKEVLRVVRQTGIIPVVTIKDPSRAVDIARALADGGISLIEVTLREPTALESIQNIRRELPDVLVGAGTVLSARQADSAIDAGADFIVSPGLNPETVHRCRQREIDIFPGAVTASEIELGLSLGLTVFKFFPTVPAGGLDAINMFKGPFPVVRFIPTGGITLKNLATYTDSPQIAAVGGSFVADSASIAASDWARITSQAREAVRISLGFSLAHIGINHENGEKALATARWFFDLFGFPVLDNDASVFSGTLVESMKTTNYGTFGHIGIATVSMERAMAFLSKRGAAFREVRRDGNGRPYLAYLEGEIAGFAVHIVQRKTS